MRDKKKAKRALNEMKYMGFGLDRIYTINRVFLWDTDLRKFTQIQGKAFIRKSSLNI